VAGAAGVTEKTVFNHFGTKEDLVYSRADEFGDHLVAAVVHRAPGQSVFEALRRHLLDVYAVFPGAGAERHLALSRIVADSPALRAREQRIIAGYTARLAEAIPAARDGLDLAPQVLADAVMSVHRAVIEAYRHAALDGQDPAAYGPRTLAAARAAFQLLSDGLHDH
jgi:AcrR family transcriptional regulator